MSQSFLLENEEILMRTTRHPIFLIRRLALTIIIGLLPGVVANLIPRLFGGGINDLLYTLALIWAVLAAVAAFAQWYAFQHDEWIITNKRLLHYVKPFPWTQKVSTTSIMRIEDVSVEQLGLLAVRFDYGNVVCQTSAEQGNFEFQGVPKPTQMLQAIDTVREKAQNARQGATT